MAELSKRVTAVPEAAIPPVLSPVTRDTLETIRDKLIDDKKLNESFLNTAEIASNSKFVCRPKETAATIEFVRRHFKVAYMADPEILKIVRPILSTDNIPTNHPELPYNTRRRPEDAQGIAFGLLSAHFTFLGNEGKRVQALNTAKTQQPSFTVLGRPVAMERLIEKLIERDEIAIDILRKMHAFSAAMQKQPGTPGAKQAKGQLANEIRRLENEGLLGKRLK